MFLRCLLRDSFQPVHRVYSIQVQRQHLMKLCIVCSIRSKHVDENTLNLLFFFSFNQTF